MDITCFSPSLLFLFVFSAQTFTSPEALEPLDTSSPDISSWTLLQILSSHLSSYPSSHLFILHIVHFLFNTFISHLHALEEATILMCDLLVSQQNISQSIVLYASSISKKYSQDIWFQKIIYSLLFSYMSENTSNLCLI